MTQVIRIAKSGARHAPTLPVDAVTRTFGIFGVKDSGKTTTARVLAEGICKTGGNVAVLDPVGVWWGATRAGEGPGIPGVVIGGEHADVPLEKTGGALVADLVVKRLWPIVVVDMKLLRKGEAQHFMADFLEGVYFSNRRPLHLLFEEADRALPQNPRGMDPTLGRVLGAAEDIVKLGRSRGLGSSFISQRMATVTKNVTEQVEALILHAQIGPRDRKAVKDWVEANGDPERTKVVMDSMPTLQVGEAWLYSPKWLKGTLEQINVRMPKTFDSSATPSNADEERAEKQARRAPADLDELRVAMAETVQRAEANDPKKLKKRIEELEAEVERVREERPPAEPAEPVEPERILVPDREALATLVEVNADARGVLDELDDFQQRVRAIFEDGPRALAEAAAKFGAELSRSTAAYDAIAKLPAAGATVAASPAARSSADTPARPRRSLPAASPSSNGAGPTGPEQRILDALAWLATVGIEPATRTQLAMVAGYHERTKGFTGGLADLLEIGHVTYPRPGTVMLADVGRGLAHAPEEPLTDDEMQRMIFEHVGEQRARILREVIRDYPDGVSRPELAERLDYHERTKGFTGGIGSLKALGLVHFPERGTVAATDLLFPTRR